MLKIIGLNDQGKTAVFKYEPETAQLSGKRKYMHFQKQHTCAPKRERDPLVEIRISLGMECNLACSYCNQCKTKSNQEPLPTRDFVNLLSELIRDKTGEVVSIQFWGGEPLLHFPIIKEITRLLRLQNIPKHTMIGFITNGTLLTEEIVDFCIANRFSVCISHDGAGQSVRTEDPFVKNLDLVKKLYASETSCAFNSVITGANIPHQAIVGFLQEAIGHEGITISEGSPLTVSTKESIQHVACADNLFAYTQSLLVDLMQRNLAKHFIGYRMLMEEFKNMLTCPKPTILPVNACGMGHSSKITLDLAGNILSCQSVTADDFTAHGQSHKVGTIQELLHGAKPILTYQAGYVADISGCKNCPVLPLCKCGCPFEEQEIWETNCKIRYAHNLALFQMAFFELTGFLPQSIRGNFKLAGTNYLSIV